jgi:hypothetical protein
MVGLRVNARQPCLEIERVDAAWQCIEQLMFEQFD